MVITREIISKLEIWKKDVDRSPLIVQGARQIGKSWAVAEFGRTSYKYTAIFNFDKQEELKGIFEKTKDVKRILSELSLYTDVPLVESETLIFFDEIQDCKAALNSLKYFKEDAPGYHVIAAGSLLGVAVNRKTKKSEETDEMANTFPVGKVSFLEMYPVTFREFLRMSDPLLMQQTESRLELLEPLPEILFNKLTEQYRCYQVCGGLPKPCSHMLDGVGMEKIENDLAELCKSYEYDFTKHVDAKDIPRIREIWRSIPSQLSRENKKFIFRVVREGARAREYESALDWLVLSGMVYRIYVCETPQLPLKHYEVTTAFKVYMLDQAILRAMAELPPEAVIAKGDLLKEFRGAMAENFVLSSLLAQGYNSPHYWTLTGNKAEVDFLIQDGLEIRPIEVKAEENISGQSLKVYQDKYAPEIRLRFSMRNLNINGNVINIPLFLCDWLMDILSFVKRTK
ncbi:MAG: ATP-binding protein [Paludibacteraceae bacterium]|nr:ATP-binding protein [Paludibacteraceae bacterium]